MTVENHEWLKATFRSKVTVYADGYVEASAVRINHARECSPLKRRRNENAVDTLNQQSLDSAVARARRVIRGMIHENALDRMVTLTYRENVTDVSRCKRDWSRFVRLVRARYPDWQYVCVPELQERGAWHMHVACKGWLDINFLRRAWYKALCGDSSVTGADAPGAVHIRGPRGKRNVWSSGYLAGYLSKYLGKSFGANAKRGSRRYWPSGGLDKPECSVGLMEATDPVSAIVELVSYVERRVVGGWRMWMGYGGHVLWVEGRGEVPEDEDIPF